MEIFLLKILTWDRFFRSLIAALVVKIEIEVSEEVCEVVIESSMKLCREKRALLLYADSFNFL